ncbi:unnamed protein product [Mucor hiemalis]
MGYVEITPDHNSMVFQKYIEISGDSLEKFDFEEEKKELNSAFKQNTPSLPSFSLPTNLNNLVPKKRNIQQQQQLNRPRLAHLRSAWLSQQSIEEDAFSEDKFIDITLPPVTTNNNTIDKDGVIGKEIQYLLQLQQVYA